MGLIYFCQGQIYPLKILLEIDLGVYSYNKVYSFPHETFKPKIEPDHGYDITGRKYLHIYTLSRMEEIKFAMLTWYIKLIKGRHTTFKKQCV